MLARKKSLKVVESKSPVCSKGFNARSNFITCHLCDKDTHTKSIIHTFDENHFICNNCTTNVETNCATVREDAILPEMVVSGNQYKIGSESLLKKLPCLLSVI